jgi:hypothetical protein
MRDNRCPPPATLVAYARAEPVAPGTRQHTEGHLRRCGRCWERVGAMRELLLRDLAAEVAAAYRGVTALDGPLAPHRARLEHESS